MITDLVSAVLVVAGCVFFGAGTMGLLRFPDLNNRLHALVKADNLGLGLLLAGLALQATAAVAVKLVLIWLLALLAASTSSFLLADRPARAGQAQPSPGVALPVELGADDAVAHPGADDVAPGGGAAAHPDHREHPDHPEHPDRPEHQDRQDHS